MNDAELVRKLADKLEGRDNLAERVGVQVQAVTNWILRDRVGSPSRPKVREIARENGIRLPERWIWQREAA